MLSLSNSSKPFQGEDFKGGNNLEIMQMEVGEVYSLKETSLEKRFNLWSVVGMVYSSFATPIALGTYLSLVIGVGGSPYFFYSYLLTSVMNILITFSVAEIASAYPHTSAQVFWTVNSAPYWCKRSFSYFSGILSCACYIFASVADGFFAAWILLGFVQLCNPEYVSKDWHAYLICLATWVTSFLVNAFAVKATPYLSSFLNYLINLGSIFIFISLLVRSTPKQSAAFVFKDIINETGWSSNGVVFFLSILPGVSSVSLYDGACHMTDEIPNPEKNIPLVIIYSYIGAIFFGGVAIIIYLFCIVDVNAMYDPVGGMPIIQLFHDSYRSMALTSISTILILFVLFFGATILLFTSTSRLIMAFAKLKGFPFPHIFGKISEEYKSPIQALALNLVACSVIGTLLFASSTALNAVMGSYIACMYLSYLIPFVCLVLKKDRFGKEKDQRFFSLGKFGKPMNIICIFWFIFAIVWLCMPSYIPVTKQSMNYTSAVLGCVLLVGVINWFAYARTNFERVDEIDLIMHS